MNFDGKIIVTDDTKTEVTNTIKKRLDELELNYDITERKVEFTELTVTLKLDTLKAVKHLFKVVSAPDEEIKYLAKVKSVVEATAKDIITTILKSVKI